MTICKGSRLSSGSRRGQAAVEVGLMLPWLVISFIAVLDFGFCAYGLIATQNAARIGAAWGAATATNAQSANLATKACGYAIDELQDAPNMGASVTTCSGSSPIRVATSYNASGADALPTVTVTVTYKVTLMAVPGISPSSLAIVRSVQLPVR
jgi:Flp pilus assembly protein TadG